MPGIVAIGVTLNSGVENCNRFALLPFFRFKIGVVVAEPMVWPSVRLFIVFNSIKSLLFVAVMALCTPTVLLEAAFRLEVELMAILLLIQVFALWYNIKEFFFVDCGLYKGYSCSSI